MIRWKYKGRNYYFNHVNALAFIGMFVVLPLLYGWIEGVIPDIFYDKYFLITFSLTMLFYSYAIYKVSIDSYEPYYFDEKGKKIEGEEPPEQRAKRLRKFKKVNKKLKAP